MPEFNFNLSASQMGKLKKQMPFQISHGALKGEKKTHEAMVMLNDKFHKKIQSAIRRGKGLRINPMSDIEEVMTGGKIKNPFKNAGKALNKVSNGFNNAVSKLNPVAPLLENKKTSNALNVAGKVTDGYLLPAVVEAGKPLFYGTSALGSTIATGTPVPGLVASQALWKYGGGEANDPSKKQKSKTLGMVSKKAVQLGSKTLLKGSGL